MKNPFRRNRKPSSNPRIHELETENRALRNQVDYLVRTIRQTDDIIYSISQQTSWDGMRPRFTALVDQMTARKVAESNRIGALLETELRSTYTPPQAQIKDGR